MIGHCKDCKHWGLDTEGRQRGHEVFGEKKRCDQLKLSGSTDVDACGAPDTIGTAPEFGCVLFQNNEAS